MKDKAAFGLIGTGGISWSQHLGNLTRAPHVYLKTVCDINEDRLKMVQEHYHVPSATVSHKELLADPEIDAVLIATKAESHVPLAIEALESGKHVYVEKPLADTAEECRKVVDAQRAAGKMVSIGFNRRVAPAYRKAKEIISSHGGTKNIHYRISDHYWQWGINNPPGMRILHEVSHIFDILRYFADSEVKSVYCLSARADDDNITLQFESGCIATIMSTGYVWCDMPKESLEVVTELGGLFVNDFVELQTFGLADWEPSYKFAGHNHTDGDIEHKYLFEKGGARSMMDLRRICYENSLRLQELREQKIEGSERNDLEQFEIKSGFFVNYMMNKGWLQAVDHFAECILQGIPCELAGAEDGLWATRIAEAAMQSRENGQIIRF